MKITHLSTFDIQGGAARAAYRLHEDYVNYYCSWIHLIMYRFREYFEMTFSIRRMLS